MLGGVLQASPNNAKILRGISLENLRKTEGKKLVGDHRQVVEIKGQKYDAATGKVLDADKHPIKTRVTQVGAAIDGFVTRAKSPSKAIHTKPARSKTLMRQAVKKPTIKGVPGPQRDVKTQAERQMLDRLRARRANDVSKSSLVSRFGISGLGTSKVVTKHVPLAVKPAPQPSVTKSRSTAVSIPQQKISPFDRSLQLATAHQEKAPKLKKKRLHHRVAKKFRLSAKTANITLLALAILFLGGFFAYQNAAILSVRLSAARAGISVTVPGYTPAGFSLKNHSAKPGEIIMSYRSNSDSRTFAVSQSVSQWDSNALLDNFVASNQYQTTSSKGRRIYLYDGNNATWVDNGVWYKIDSKASLSADQLQKLIDSI